MTAFTPQIAEADRKEGIGRRITNLPRVGTRVRATLGKTVLVGTLRNHESQEGKTLDITLDGLDGEPTWLDTFRETYIWFESGWTIEFETDQKEV